MDTLCWRLCPRVYAGSQLYHPASEESCKLTSKLGIDKGLKKLGKHDSGDESWKRRMGGVWIQNWFFMLIEGNHDKEIWYDEVFLSDLYTKYISLSDPSHQRRILGSFFEKRSSIPS